MNCQLSQSSASTLKCSVCGKTLPIFANWKAAKVSCGGPRKMPGVIQQAKNLIGSARAIVAEGLQFASDEQQAERLAICRGCDQLDQASERCFKCGCFTAMKRKLKTESCPMGKWPDIRPLSDKGPAVLAPFTGPLRRNLIMYIFPMRGPRGHVAEWRRNLHQVLSRIDLFDGQRVFAVAVDHSTDDIEAVAAELAGVRCEVLEFGNRRELGEVVAFQRLLERIRSEASNEISYYCHAKGASKQHSPQIASIRRWADSMHEVLLDGVDAVELALNTKVFAGAFRAVSAQFPSGLIPAHNWHYPGTFFWFRNDVIFSGDKWDKISQEYWGSEAWPGTQAPLNQSACLLLDRVGLATLYSPETWMMTAQPALDRWRARRLEMMEK